MELTKEQIDILDHTVNRATGSRFCGGGTVMDSLVKLGLMRSIGRVSWCPDEFFTVTDMGIAALKEAQQ